MTEGDAGVTGGSLRTAALLPRASLRFRVPSRRREWDWDRGAVTPLRGSRLRGNDGGGRGGDGRKSAHRRPPPPRFAALTRPLPQTGVGLGPLRCRAAARFPPTRERRVGGRGGDGRKSAAPPLLLPALRCAYASPPADGRGIGTAALLRRCEIPTLRRGLRAAAGLGGCR